MSASSGWRITNSEFPVNGSPREKLGFALKYVALAATERNRQLWNVRLEDTHLEVIANEDADLETTDPDGREVFIGCGATLMYLKLALKHFGCLGRVALFPDLGQPELVARVHFGFCGERNTRERLLFDAMAPGPANVCRTQETPLSETVLTLLSQAATGERGWLDFMRSEMSRERVMDTEISGDSLWMNVDPSTTHATDPIPSGQALGWLPPLLAFANRSIDNQSRPAGPPRQPSVPNATLAVVKTKTDDKYGWLTAGEIMARIFLQAQAASLSLAFFNPVRRRAAREALRVAVGHKGFAQAILSFGLQPAADTVLLNEPTTSSLKGPNLVSLNYS